MKSDTSVPQPFRSLARRLCAGEIAEADLPAFTGALPRLDSAGLNALGAEAARAARAEPRYGWALTAVAATCYTNDLALQALAQWHLARAANGWYRPRRARAAVAQAKAGFAQLEKPEWLAACTWQAHAVPWMGSDFAGAAAALEEAVPVLEAELPRFAPDGRLSLAYAYLLIGRFAEAAAEVDQAESAFANAQDRYGVAQCLYYRAAYQRRNSDFGAAQANLERALDIFQEENAPVFVAIVRHNQGYLTRLATGNLEEAEKLFREAVAQFTALDLPLWQAQSRGALAQLYNYAGKPTHSQEMLRQAGEIYAGYDIPGLRADNLLDQGEVALFQGKFERSIALWEEAQELYRQAGNRWMPSVALMNRGYAHYLRGEYHRALKCLEEAYEQMQKNAVAYRLASCATRLGEVWVKLKNYQRAERYVQEAMILYEQLEKVEWLPQLLLLQAEIAHHQNNPAAVHTRLQEALRVAAAQRVRVLLALTHRLTGEHLILERQWSAAQEHLQAALSHFNEMGMVTEQATCLLALGKVHTGLNHPPAAKTVWEQAFALTEIPELQWQAQMELAHHAARHEGSLQALHHYRAGMAALTQQRRQLWQPTLAGSYLHRAVPHADQAVSLAFQEREQEAALQFVEESKAQIVMQQLTQTEQRVAALPQEVQELVLEIRWLQNRFNQAQQGNAITRLSATELQTELTQKVKAYHAAMDQLERAAASGRRETEWGAFAPVHFRRLAKVQLGDAWVALDYYLTTTAVYCALLTPSGITLHSAERNGRLQEAVRVATRHQGRHPRTSQALTYLGDTLVPPALWERLTPETTLLISPHGALHRLPWAGLRSPSDGQWLVETAVTAVTPSLHSLVQLWQRPQLRTGSDSPGLLLMASTFSERHPPLSAVADEQARLQRVLTPSPHLLSGAEATAANLRQTQQRPSWTTHPFLHVATHAFTDQLTGRLSGIALHDRDLWLDELRHLAPLPPLLTFSACSGLRSRLYTGDEPLGLPTTCLAAGARQVIGSLWPVLDAATPQFMERFYQQWQSGHSAAAALAQVQRMAVREKTDLLHWAGYQCFGLTR